MPSPGLHVHYIYKASERIHVHAHTHVRARAPSTVILNNSVRGSGEEQSVPSQIHKDTDVCGFALGFQHRSAEFC